MNDSMQEYFDRHDQKLDQIEAMWEDPKIQFYHSASIPTEVSEHRIRSVYLEGPSSRGQIPEHMWRAEAVHLLRKNGYDGWIFIPEPRGPAKEKDFVDKEAIYSWESSRIFVSQDVVYWIPRDSDSASTRADLSLGIMMMRTSRSFSTQRLWVGYSSGMHNIGRTKHFAARLGVELTNDLHKICRKIAHAKPKQI